MKPLKVMVILITDRIKEAGKTQKVLTEFGHIIKSRMGFHEVSAEKCSRVGVVTLYLIGEITEQQNLETALQQIEGIQFKSIEFTF